MREKIEVSPFSFGEAIFTESAAVITFFLKDYNKFRSLHHYSG